MSGVGDSTPQKGVVLRDIDWDETSQSHKFRIARLFKDKVLSLAELDLVVTEFDEGCVDGQRRFLEFVMKSLMTFEERNQWERDTEVRKYLIVWGHYKDTRDRLMNTNDPWRRADRICRYAFAPREDLVEFCAYCGMIEEDHSWYAEWRAEIEAERRKEG